MPSYAGNVPFDPHISVPAPDIAKAGNYAQLLYEMGRNFGQDYRAGQEFNYQQRQRNLFQNGFPTDANGNPDYNKAMQMAVQAGGGEALTDPRLNFMLRQQFLNQPVPGYPTLENPTGGGAGGGGGPSSLNVDPSRFSHPTASDDNPYGVDPALLGVIKGEEGYRSSAYPDGRQTSIGYGTRAQYPGERIDQQEAERRLRLEVNQAAGLVDGLGVDMSPAQRNALIDLTYNAGPGWMQGPIGVAVRNGDWGRAAQMISGYHTTQGGQQLRALQERRAREASWIASGGGNPNGVSGGGGPPGTSPSAPAGAPSTAAGVAGPGPAPLPSGVPGGGGPPPPPPSGPSGAPPVTEVSGVPPASQTFRAPGRTQFPTGGTETMVDGMPIRPAAPSATGPAGITGVRPGSSPAGGSSSGPGSPTPISSAPPPPAIPTGVAPPTGGFSPSGAPVAPAAGPGVGAGTPAPPVGGFAPGAPLPGGGPTTAVTPGARGQSANAPTTVLQGGGVHFAPGVSVTGIPMPESAVRAGLTEEQLIQRERTVYENGMNALALQARRMGLANINDSPELADRAKTYEVYNADATRREEALRTLSTPSENERTAARMNMNPIEYQAAQKQAEETAQQNAKFFATIHQGLSGGGMSSAQQKQNIDVLRQVAAAPDFRPGFGSDVYLDYQRLAAQFGINPAGAAPREVFNQVAARVLGEQFDQLKVMATQLGEQGVRIFKPMLDMEEKANITHEDTLAGIRAKIDLLDHTGDLMMRWADRADDYAASHGGALDHGFLKDLRAEIARARLPNAVPGGPRTAPAGQTSGPARAGGAYIWTPDHGLMPVQQRGGAAPAPARAPGNSLNNLGP